WPPPAGRGQARGRLSRTRHGRAEMTRADPVLPDGSGGGTAPRALALHEAAVRLADLCRLLLAVDQVVELRALDVQRGAGLPHTEAGFFDAAHLREMAVGALRVSPSARGGYFTLNPPQPPLRARPC